MFSSIIKSAEFIYFPEVFLSACSAFGAFGGKRCLSMTSIRSFFKDDIAAMTKGLKNIDAI